jgi:hypothetical protein
MKMLINIMYIYQFILPSIYSSESLSFPCPIYGFLLLMGFTFYCALFMIAAPPNYSFDAIAYNS